MLDDRKLVNTNRFSILKNTVTSEDSILSLGEKTWSFTHFSFGESKTVPSYPTKDHPGLLFKNVYSFDMFSREHLRISYSLFDMIGDLGGVF